MTEEQISISYQLAEDVYFGNKTLKEAKEYGARSGISPNSVNYYCSSFRHMMNGTRHTGSIGTEVREYFLSKIFSKYDDSINNDSVKFEVVQPWLSR